MIKLHVVVVKSALIIAAEVEVQRFKHRNNTNSGTAEAGAAGVSLSSGLTEATLKLTH